MLQAPNVSMLLILGIFFAALWLLNRYVFVPISAILDEREKETSGATRAYSEALAELQSATEKIEADLSLARREALKVREERRAEGMTLRSARIERAKDETAKKLSSASAELERHSRSVTADLPGRVVAFAQLLAEKILGRKVAA